MAGTKRGMPYERTGPFPLDDTFVLSKAEMLTVDDLKMPDVYFAACSDDKQFYMYDKSATPSAETGKFKVLEGGGSGNIVELTQAEYDALTDEQKMDGTVYFITDGAGGGGGGTGHGIPVGGLTGQYLVKKTGADYDVEWANIDVPEGWGVDKTGNIQMTLTNMSANQYIWLGDNYVTSIDDYMVSVDIIGGPESAWGHPEVMVTNKALDHFRIGVHTDIADPAWFKVNYIVFKKDAGGLGGVSLPKGGTAEQILAKVSDTDGDAKWITDTGKYLVARDYAYGYRHSTGALYEIPGEYIGLTKRAHTYSIAKTSVITTWTDLRDQWDRIYSVFDFYGVAELEYDNKIYTQAFTSEGRVRGTQQGSDVRIEIAMFLPPYIEIGPSDWRTHRIDSIYVDFVSEDDTSIKVSVWGVTNKHTNNTPYVLDVTSFGLRAKASKNLGTTSEAIPNLVSNLTGMVLDDLHLSNSTIPTTWGVARIANLKMYMTNKQSYQYLWIGDLGFTSVDDYAIFVDITGGMDAAWGKPTVIVSNKSATEAGISLECDSAQAEWFNVNYVIIGKGYGNLIGANNATLESPNGTKYRLKVADDGTLSTEVV